MRFPAPLQPAVLLRRYQRFLADVRTPAGEILTVHCPNSGAMTGCNRPGSPVLLSASDNPRRKYRHTLELVQADGVWIGVNTGRTNGIVAEGLQRGVVTELAGFLRLEREVRVSGRSRLDFRLHYPGGRALYLEVKNCTLADHGLGLFPDAVTSRGRRHLEELMALAAAGHRAAVLFCVQREDVVRFAPATAVDPAYAQALGRAAAAGVMVLAYRARVRETGVDLESPLPVVVPHPPRPPASP